MATHVSASATSSRRLNLQSSPRVKPLHLLAAASQTIINTKCSLDHCILYLSTQHSFHPSYKEKVNNFAWPHFPGVVIIYLHTMTAGCGAECGGSGALFLPLTSFGFDQPQIT